MTAKSKVDPAVGDFSEIWEEYQSFIDSLPHDDKCFWKEYDDDSFVSGTFGRFYRKVKIEEKENIGDEIFSEYADGDLYCKGEEITSALSTIKELNPSVFDKKTGILKLITMRISEQEHTMSMTGWNSSPTRANGEATSRWWSLSPIASRSQQALRQPKQGCMCQACPRPPLG